MKLEQVSEHIWSITAWVLIPIRVWLVRDGDELTLVDAGIPTMARGILRCIDRLGTGSLSRIVLTHGHPDHVGAIRAIQRRKSVPLYAHPIEIPYMEGQRPYPRRRKAHMAVAKGLTHPLMADRDGSLKPIGGLKPYLTPGHSPGHVVYYHEKDGVLLAGDLFTSRRGQLRRPMAMFTSDMDEAIRSSAIVGQLKPARLEVSHGGPVLQPADQLATYLGS